MLLTIANKLYSSWSARPWLVLTAFGIPFEETVIPMYQPDSKARMLAVSPTGKLPCLSDGGVKVWESLAIIEYVAETFPEKPIWPGDAKARAHARAAASEMHAGFQALRNACPMNLGKRFARKDRGPEVAADVARLTALWKEARAAFAGEQPFLYGAFSAADAMFAPAVSRLDTYQIEVDAETHAYMDRVHSHPAFVAWRSAALREPWHVAHYERGETTVETFHHQQS
ncbi:MAG: glutathione S-transferase family protein [Hyphomicrobiaceae bacterium]|nr:glutathione S-transferase family protein [Hyphomicrobiaceae bacterium]